ncbi:DEAD/DEAH box helicase [Clostridium perfringens]|uniref:DEAD/DEAH box helicase n=1 Tax=Clostridium perfringens TaxID=1502 RepID=UPI003BA97C22
MIGLELKDFQEKAVDFLLDKTSNDKQERKIIMQSPTGSGKTIILISYIEEYFSFYNDTVFVWITPGKGELEEQSKEKMERFAPTLKTGLLDDVLNSGFNTETTYFINWEKITKKGNKSISDTERKNLFEQVKVAHRTGYKFILIIDEEHQNNTAKADDIITAISAEFEIRVSATPVKRAIGEFYKIDEIDVINEELITRAMYINYDLITDKIGDIFNETDILIDKADEVRKQIAQAYIDEGEDIRPLVLIQFPNMNDDLIQRVEDKLNSMGYTYENKLLASWFSAENKEDKNSKKLGKINIGTAGEEDSIINHDAKPVFLLFKQALATGWDCPRAKVLVKLRENMSERFEIQTLGRLRRMPKARHYGKDILDCSFLYTFDEEYKNAAINVGAHETTKVFLKEEPKNISLVKEVRHKDSSYADERQVRNNLYKFFKERYSLGTIKADNRKIFENNKYFISETIKTYVYNGKVIKLSDLEDISNLSAKKMEYDVNTHVHGIELRQSIDMMKNFLGLDYKRTRAILENLFRINEGNKNYKLLNLSLKEFYSFIINNVVLLRNDLREYQGKRYIQESLNLQREEEFKIPVEEYYFIDENKKNPKLMKKNVYKDFTDALFSGGMKSKPERLFEKYCERSNNVKYLYKNGDGGQDYLSIVYVMGNGIQRNFYPDYVIQLNDESIWIIETKGGETRGTSNDIDIQSANKFDQFKRFAEKNKYNFAFVRNIDEDLFYCNTEYTDDMSGENWKPLDEIF